MADDVEHQEFQQTVVVAVRQSPREYVPLEFARFELHEHCLWRRYVVWRSSLPWEKLQIVLGDFNADSLFRNRQI